MSSPTELIPKQDSHTTDLSKEQQKGQGPTCCGRKISLCDCITPKQLFIISGIVGGILLVLGLLALAGTFAPQTGGSVTTIVQNLKNATEIVASGLGTDAFTLSIFTASFGAAFTFSGIVGFIIQHFRDSHAKEENPTEGKNP